MSKYQNMIQELPVLDHGYVRLIDHMGTDARILEAARVSYRSQGKGEAADKKLLEYLFTHKHTSPFEMCKVTFNIKMPIFVMRQFIRHRMQNVNEVSARYTELPNEFYIPKAWRPQDTKNKQGSLNAGDWNPVVSKGWKPEDSDMLGVHDVLATQALELCCQLAYNTYEQMLKAGVAREMARMVLPVNIYTEIYSTWDLSNLLKFFFLRDDPHAQWEHQQFALAMKQITAQLFPWTMEIYENTRNPQSVASS